MSRYVHVALGALTLDDVAQALQRLEVPHTCGELMLEGSLECAGEPVAIRIEPAPMGAVEDFGFVLHETAVRLVCGELDQGLIERELLPRLRAEIARARVRSAAEAAGLEIDETLTVDRASIVVRRR